MTDDNMSQEDYDNASMALVDWFKSQDIRPDQAIGVLLITLIGCIETVARRNGRTAKEGARLAADILMEGTS